MSDFAKNTIVVTACILAFFFLIGFGLSKVPPMEHPTIKACRERGGVPMERWTGGGAFESPKSYWTCEWKDQK